MRISDWSSDVCSSDLVDDQPEPAPKAAAKPAPLITEPGAYPDIDIDDYHHNANLLPGPSLSASGAKTIINRSPLHFWAASPLNPNPPEREEKPHFAIGKMAHDFLLTPDRIADKYFVLPKGFNETFTDRKSTRL